VFEGPQGNGFTFEAHTHRDFVDAINRAIKKFEKEDEYKFMRQCAVKSTLDMESVAQAWAREFARLRKCIWVGPKAVRTELAKLKAENPFEAWEPQSSVPELSDSMQSADL